MSTILSTNPTNLDLAKKCLALIRDVAARGACSEDPDLIGYSLQELTQVLLERTGTEERLFEPVPPHRIHDLEKLYEELAFVDSSSQSMAACSTAV
jgi:hypothetical protein